LRFKPLLLTLVFFSLFTNCEKKPTSSPLPPVSYLPLNPGNWWEYVYCDSADQDSLLLRVEIGDTITLFGFKGYSFESDFLPYDFIHVRNDTVILSQALHYNQRRVFLINKAGVEADWELYSVLTPDNQYEVRAHQERKVVEVELKNGENYSNCIQIKTRAYFDSGDWEELGFNYFARDVGMVKFILRPVLEHTPLAFELHRYNLK